MHAVLVKVRIDATRAEEALKGLQEHVVPQVKESRGFVRGTWFGDGPGYGLLIFESEEQAQDMAGGIGSTPGAPTQVEEVGVHEVKAQAES